MIERARLTDDGETLWESFWIFRSKVVSIVKVDIARNGGQERHKIPNRKSSNLSAISEPNEVKRRSYESPGVEDFLRLASRPDRY